jgi:uncharacterized membrane protein
VLRIAIILIMAMAANARADDPDGLSYICSGNEPFWRIEMNQASAVLTRPGADEIEEHVFAGSLDTLDFLDPPWSVWRGRKTDNNGGALVVVARKETCRDTMSDEAVFDHRAVVSFPEGHAATGCCHAVAPLSPAGAPPADLADKAADDDPRLSADFKPAIDACLAAAPGNARAVLKAWPMNRGRIGVRLADDSGQRLDCIVIDGSNMVERIDAVAADAPALPGERAPVFLPSNGPPPRVTCGRLSRVVDYRGATAGYLHDRGGCPGN